MQNKAQRTGSLLLVILPLGLVLFLLTMSLARRSSAVRHRVVHTKNIRQARNLADSAVADGLAQVHLKIQAFVKAQRNKSAPNHDEILKNLQGKNWKLAPKATQLINDNNKYEITTLEASIPKDTPITNAHIADIEVLAKVCVKEGKHSFSLRLRQRRAFRINDSQMAVFLCRRYHQYHLLQEAGDQS